MQTGSEPVSYSPKQRVHVDAQGCPQKDANKE